MFEFTTAAERAHILKRVFIISKQVTLPDGLWRPAPYMCLEDGEAWALTGRRPSTLSPPGGCSPRPSVLLVCTEGKCSYSTHPSTVPERADHSTVTPGGPGCVCV